MSASSLWQRGSIAAVVTTALLVSACGSSSSSGTAAAGTTPGAVATAAAGASAKAVAPTHADPAPTTSKIVAKGGGNFCKSLAAAINSNAVTSGGTTPADLKASIQNSEKVGLEALSKAPSAIKPDVKILLDASAKLFAALKKNNYDFTKLTAADEAAFSTPAVDAASKKVGAYVKADCGIDLGTAAGASS